MKNIILKLIKIYQKTFSPDHSVSFASNIGCRFYPSCSEYTYEAIERYGVAKGTSKGFLRLLRCSPFSKGGIDPVN